MNVPLVFREEDLGALHALIRGAGLGQFVTSTREGPLATPLPMTLAAEEGEFGTIYGHVSKANPQWRVPSIGNALAIFMGVDAYVSPGWYPSTQAHGKVVPTWNYEVVHAAGPVTFFHDPAKLLEVVTVLTDQHEAGRSAPWRVGDAPPSYIEEQLDGIVGFRMPIARLVGKRKLSQNRSPEDRAGVVAGLTASGCPATLRAAELMRANIERP